jgi:hypothetical protein
MGILLIAFASVCPSSPTSLVTRIREAWPAAKLTAKADLIIIAKLARTEDSPKADKLSKQYQHLIGVNSTFMVLAVVKGHQDKKELTLLHFRRPTHQEGIGQIARTDKISTVSWIQQSEIDGPDLIEPEWLKGKDIRFLMFLKRRADGRVEAISGQVDPVLSVNKLVGDSDDR